MAWKEAMKMFCNFLNFFAIVLEFSISGQVGTHRDNFSFIFSLSWPIPNYFHLKRSYDGFLNFLNFFAIFWNFLLQVGQEHIGTIVFIFSLSQPFSAYFCLKWSYDGGFPFLKFFCYFFGIFYYGSCRNTAEQFFLFSLFLGLSQPILAWKEDMMAFSNF